MTKKKIPSKSLITLNTDKTFCSCKYSYVYCIPLRAAFLINFTIQFFVRIKSI